MRIGIDLGGTKTEGIALDSKGRELRRIRVDSPRGDYRATIATITKLVQDLEEATHRVGSVGVGIPGTIIESTGLVKNSNSTWINGNPLQRDLSESLQREVRCANDANCFAVSEATDGAAAGKAVVFGVIIGTGCGGGVVLNGRVHAGRNGIGGEWGHIPLPWATADELPGTPCYCGHSGCLETWISGTGFERDFLQHTGKKLRGREIIAALETGDTDAIAALDRLKDRLARGLAVVANILDPDVVVLGGGLSNIDRLYQGLTERLASYVFGSSADTPILKNVHGDSSGVRGAAWLWQPGTAPESDDPASE